MAAGAANGQPGAGIPAGPAVAGMQPPLLAGR